MSNTLMKSASSWTDACSGASMSRVSVPDAYVPALGGRQRWQCANLRDLRDLRALRHEQLIQDDQGRSVFEHPIEDMSVPAPATALKGATAKGGVSGPYPWRRPV
ncbi:hypothetical protein [Actinomadura chokoriensis]|uniref:Uncharacterized protein n=1 Tax=Actinomadura chokoriensis TaxID=454156 RepID=A0ABV4QRF5_9ACTN